MKKRIITSALCLILFVTSMAYANPSVVKTIEAPQNLTVEVKTYEDGQPYFQLKMQVPDSVKKISEESEELEAELFYEAEFRIENGNWEPTGAAHFTTGSVFDINPKDMGIGEEVDIKANVYQFRVRFSYCPSAGTDENGNKIAAEPVNSSYSNVASTAVAAYKKPYESASAWATAELDKAAEHGFITEKISVKMDGPITREEICEVLIKLYEKMIGAVSPSDVSAFSDTKNPEIYKAYELGIVTGIGNGKFAPNELTNREQVAAMMHRAVKKIDPSADFSITGVGEFSDENRISSWALESVKFMNKNGIIKGSDGYINPKGTTTREQAVLMVLRTYEKYSE